MAAICGRVGRGGDGESPLFGALDQMSRRAGPLRRFRAFPDAEFASAGSERLLNAGGMHLSEDGSTCLLYDGVIFDPPGASNAVEAIFKGYRREGPEYLNALDGSFSLALWDDSQEQLVLARDEAGTRPLYYSTLGRKVVFASELTAISHLSGRSHSLDPRGVDLYLSCLYVPAPYTASSGIFQVAPGQVRVFQSTGDVRTVAKVEVAGGHQPGAPLTSEAFVELLGESLSRRRGLGTAPGFCLSGGVDTATLVAISSRQSGLPARTFTIGFPDAPKIDERRAAGKTARLYGTVHREIVIGDECIDVLGRLTRIFGTPIGHPAALVAHVLFGRAGAEVSEMVCGDGGNEILDGCYHSYQLLSLLSSSDSDRDLVRLGRRVWHLVRRTPLVDWYERAARRYFRGRVARAARGMATLDASRRESAMALIRSMEMIWKPLQRASLYTPDFAAAVGQLYGGERFTDGFSGRDDAWSILDEHRRMRLRTFVPFNAIPHVEFAASDNDVFPWFPFADARLVRRLLEVRAQELHAGGLRGWMQRLLTNVVPGEIFRRPARGFAAPMQWLTRPRWRELITDALSEDRVRRRGMFSTAYVSGLLNRAFGKRKTTPPVVAPPDDLLLGIWTLVAIDAWISGDS